MKTTAFASRNTKEILRDPVTVFFGLGFPIVLMVLLSAINATGWKRKSLHSTLVCGDNRVKEPLTSMRVGRN